MAEMTPFMAREWVFNKIDKTIDTRNQCVNSTNVTAIFGCAGSGKTVLLKQLSHIQKYRDNLLAFFECTENTNTTHFIADIEAQIKSKLNIKNNTKNIYEEEVATSDDIFRFCVLFPLIESVKCANLEHQFIIAIDSIDTNEEICQLISNHIHLMPKWIHLIVSARPKRRRGFTKMFSGSRKIVIDDMRKVNVINDMKCYIMHRIKQLNCGPMGISGKKALNQIGIKSNGCFLYVKLILDCFESSIMKTDEVDDIGATLNGLYLALCNKLFENRSDSEIDYKLIISITLASQPFKLTKASLQRCLCWDSSYIDTKIGELCLYSILSYNNVDNTLQISHTSLVEWITDVKHCTRKFLCDKSFGHIVLALCDSNNSISDHHYHILNSNICTFSLHHYALWLIMTTSYSDVETLIRLEDESPIIHFIRNCKNSLIETKPSEYNLSNDYIRNCYSLTGSDNENQCRDDDNNHRLPKFDTFKEDTDYIELLAQFQRALFSNNSTILRDILTNESDLLNHNFIKQKTPMYWAVKSENIGIVELFIEFDVDVNAVCDIENGFTPLMIAVCQNCIDMCEVLLDSDADVDACDSLSRSALVHAILQHSSPKIVELLLFWGAHTDYMDHLGRSLLCLASNESQCSVDTIRLLLAVGCDELHRDNNGKTALHLAASHGNADIIEALLDIGGDTLQHSRDNEGKYALHYSASGGYFNACKLLITPETINALSHDGKSALRLATFNAHLDVVTLLVENGADINYVDADGRSTIYCVASGSNADITTVNILQHLVKLGADLELKDFEGRTALHVAAWQGLKCIVEALIDLEANLNAIDTEGRTALHMSVWNGHFDIVNILLDAGCDVNHVSATQGATPLLIAAQQGHIDACTLLLSAGSDVNHVDLYGRNAHEVAINCGHRDIAILLESRTLNREQCPTMSSHASTAETAAIGEIEALFDFAKISSKDSLRAKRDNSRKHKKMMSISKLTKLLH